MPTVTERLEMLFDARTGGAITEIKKLNAAMEKTGEAQTKTGGATGFLQSKLEGLGLSAGMASTVMTTAVPLAAGAAGAALLKFGKDAVDSTVSWASGIRLVQQATGATAETSSRLVAIFDDYNISTESGTKSLAKFGTNLANNKSQLADNGIQIAKNKDGTIDLVGSLENAADAYKNAGSAAERDKLVLDAFGKSGRDLIPILEQGSAGIEKMFANVPHGQILSQQQIDQARQYQLAVDDLQDVMLELKLAIGTEIIPIITKLAETMATATRPAIQFGDALKSVGINSDSLLSGAIKMIPVIGPSVGLFNDLGGAFGFGGKQADALTEAQKRLSDAQKEVAKLAAEHKTHTQEGRDAQQELTAATDNYTAVQGRVIGAIAEATGKTKEATSATTDYTTVIDGITAAQQRYADSTLAVIGLQLSLTASEQQVEEAIKKHNDALAQNGENSLEAREAQTQLEQSILTATEAAVKADAAQANLAGQTQTTADKVNIQRGELESLKQKYPELTPIIDGYIARLNSTPTVVRTDAELIADSAEARLAEYHRQLDLLPRSVTTQIFQDIFGGVTPRQHGGPIPGGVNQAVPILAHGGEYVLSADVVDRIKAGRPSRGARPPSFDETGTTGGGGSPGPITVQVVLDGQIVGRSTVEYINRQATRGPGPLLPSSTS